ncbi:pentatricopeptide repeat-containing protein At3g22690-like, partial [Ananas comosus]|uniref:Pentatricopeptide repeat-containing protein At3g22690-like n=1 Tax=Ananas comosus TaxID=4615 RepID=A0A6P5EAI6_ANACO
MTVNGLLYLPSSVSKLVAAYSKIPTSESLHYAIKAFELLREEEAEEEEEADPFLWNSLIRGYSSIGSLDEALKLYIGMVSVGVVPDRFSFPPLLTVCSKILAFEEGQQLHGVLLKIGEEGGVQGDLFIQNSLVHFYVECGEMSCAQRVFDGMLQRNVVSWTSLIDGYAKGDCSEKAISLFHDMVRDGRIEPNSVTMACVLSACARLQDLMQGEKICSYISNSGVGSSSLVNPIIDMYMSCGATEKARQIFDDCKYRDIVLWNIMVSNYARNGMAKEALCVVNEMLLSKQRPDRVTVLAGLSASAQLGAIQVGKQLHAYILRNGLDCWDVVNNSVIDMYMKCRNEKAARKVFDIIRIKILATWNTIINGFVINGDYTSAWEHFNMMPERDLISWNTMICALVQDSQLEEAVGLFRKMQDSELKPDTATLVSVASACGYLGSLDLAKWVYTYTQKKRISRNVRLGTALVDMFSRCGDSRSAMHVFGRMPIKDVAAWTAAIGAMAFEGNGNQAFKLFSEMINHGVKPDGLAFVGVLTAYSHAGSVEEGCTFFHSMSNTYGFTPQIVHYGCLVDLLSRAGLLAEAQALIESMPMEPNDVIWRALLASSRIHRDIEMAEYATKKVLESAPEKSGARILLSNMYASAGRWNDVAKVRLSMRDKGVRKTIGSSKID